MWRIALLAALVGCGTSSANDDPPREPPRPVRLEHEAMVRYHMQRHFDDLRTIERMLIDGHLDEAKDLAFMLTKTENDAGVVPWAREAQAVVDAARGLAAAPGTGEALRRVTLVSAACAGCHLATQKVPVFAKPASPPPDRSTPVARMARHAWAVDRVWEGMVAASNEHWRAGLDVLSGTPLPDSPAPATGAELQALAKSARDRAPAWTLEERAAAYAKILTTCAGCHAAVQRK